MLNVGFSTGCFYNIREDIYSKEIFTILSKTNSNSIEILVTDFSQIDSLLNINPQWLKSFSHISIHAPVKNLYEDNNETREALYKLKEAKDIFNARLIVIHPDLVKEAAIFKEHPSLPLAVENMDKSKSFGQKPLDLELYIKDYNFKFLLDLQHIFVNDPSLELCDDFLDIYLDDLEEIHISGFGKVRNHSLLYITKQNQLIKKLKQVILRKNVPIIIESVIDNEKDLELELEYLSEFLLAKELY
jgi:hypothetical protein